MDSWLPFLGFPFLGEENPSTLNQGCREEPFLSFWGRKPFEHSAKEGVSEGLHSFQHPLAPGQRVKKGGDLCFESPPPEPFSLPVPLNGAVRRSPGSPTRSGCSSTMRTRPGDKEPGGFEGLPMKGMQRSTYIYYIYICIYNM